MQISPEKLTPSEVILIQGDHFANRSIIGNIELPYINATVSASELVNTILSCAFLTNESLGAITLKTVRRRLFFGLITEVSLFVYRENVKVGWPNRCLEHKINTLAERLVVDNENVKVSDIVYTWLGSDDEDPWKWALRRIGAGIEKWEKFERLGKDVPFIPSYELYTISDTAVAAAERQPLKPIQQLLTSCREDRPDVWKALMGEIFSGINRRIHVKDVDYASG